MTLARLRAWRLAALIAALLLTAACGGADSADSDDGSDADADTASSEPAETGAAAEEEGGGDYVIGVSNTLVGNGWREEMICSVKAQSLASGDVSSVVVANRNGGPTEQIADLQNLISQGVDAIIVNPSDRDALNPVIEAAAEQGIVTVAVDQAVSSEEAYVVTNDQVAYGQLGAEWLFEKIGGDGNVAEMRGIDGVPADTDRHDGFTQALESYPGINVVSQTFTGWDFSQGGQQALELLNTEDLDGIWTSGIDYTVVNAMETANVDYIPVVGADNNEFLNQMMSLQEQGFEGAAVTNPATIGGVGTAIALQVLNGEDVERETILTPEVWDMDEDAQTVEENYFPDRDPTFSSRVSVEPYTTYTPEQLFECNGPGE
jgi:ribose transport system substrate-binding protein